MQRLSSPPYLAFPFKVGADGPKRSERAAHIREQIEQVLFTNPRERVFRPQFGAGVRRLLFEPNSSTLWELTRKRLTNSLANVLRGEVDPKTLKIVAQGDGEKLYIRISYTLAAIGQQESHEFIFV